MITFDANELGLFLQYEGDRDPDLMWVLRRLQNDPPVRIRKCFFFSPGDLIHPKLVASESEADEDHAFVGNNANSHYEGALRFQIGELDGEYYRLRESAIKTTHRFYFHLSVRLDASFFIAHRDISILNRLDKILDQDLRVGGSHEDAMPESAYRNLINRFPTSAEMDRYAAARIDACIRDYVDTGGDKIEAYQLFLNNKIEKKETDILLRFARSELEKYQFVAEKLRAMLDSEVNFSEAQWQAEIIDIVRTIFPKYIRVFEKVHIRDKINDTYREIDIMLVDVSGHVDVIEIKKPFNHRAILSKGLYRGNFLPAKELSGSIMQLEKYILYLDKWGVQGEKILTERYKSKLPHGMSLKIINPKGIVILGRSSDLTAGQRFDLEVIKRKYRSIVDVITYDDLLDRIDTLVKTFSGLGSETR